MGHLRIIDGLRRHKKQEKHLHFLLRHGDNNHSCCYRSLNISPDRFSTTFHNDCNSIGC